MKTQSVKFAPTLNHLDQQAQPVIEKSQFNLHESLQQNKDAKEKHAEILKQSGNMSKQ